MSNSAGELVAAGLAAAGLAALTSPVGVSGAVFLLPVQISMLGVPSPAVTATNLVYNIVATPGALAGHAHAGRLRGPLTRLLLFGTVPGAACGALVRVAVLPDASATRVLAGALLLPLGLSLLLRGPPAGGHRDPAAAPHLRLVVLALAVGTYGAMTGVGGGSIIAPVLLLAGYAAQDAAGPALCATFVASVVAVAAFQLLDALGVGTGTVAPIWSLGFVLGVGGVVGSWLGLRLHRRLPEAALRRLLGGLATAVGLRYLADIAM